MHLLPPAQLRTASSSFLRPRTGLSRAFWVRGRTAFVVRVSAACVSLLPVCGRGRAPAWAPAPSAGPSVCW